MNMSTKSYFHMDMHTRPATQIAGLLFMLGAVIHLTRLLFGWNVMIAGMVLPLWASLIAIPVALIIGFMLLREAKT